MKYILAALVLTFSMQSSADSWLCITDHAAGMALENGSWESTRIAPGDKYLIKEADERRKAQGYVYQVHMFGDDIPTWVCGDFGSEKNHEGLLVCDDDSFPGNTFKYNPRNGHSLLTYTLGYVHGKDTLSADTPVIAIGKCSKL